MRAARLLVPVTALALLGACAGPADDAGDTPTGDTHSDDGTSGPATGPSDERRIKTMSGHGDDEAEAAASADLTECIQGTWEVVPESLEQAMVASTDAWFDATATVTGSMTMTFDVATVTTRYEDFSMTGTSREGTEVFESTSRVSGTTVAAYSLDRDALSTAATDASGLKRESTTTVNGVEPSNPELEEWTRTHEDSSVTAGRTDQVTCSDSVLVLVPLTDGGAPMPDLAVTATRRS